MFRRKKESDQERRERMVSVINIRLNPPEIQSDVRYSLSMDDYENAEDALRRWEKEHAYSTFQEELLDHISEKRMSTVSFYKKAHFDRKLFSAIKNNRDYNPQKTTAIACCLALNLDIDETKSLLEKAGYSLSDAKRWDVIISHCIECKYYDIDDVNFILEHFGEKLLGF